jgi:hypothetical protein
VSSDPVARDGTGDDEEHRDEVLAVSITPVQSEKSGHDVSGGGPERSEEERGTGRRELYARLNVSSQPKNQEAPRRGSPLASAVVRPILFLVHYPERGQDPRVGGKSATGRARYPKSLKIQNLF